MLHQRSGTVPAVVPVRAPLVSGHGDERRSGSSLADGDLHTLQLRRHLASQEETRSADDVHQATRTRLCGGEGKQALMLYNWLAFERQHGEKQLQLKDPYCTEIHTEAIRPFNKKKNK